MSCIWRSAAALLVTAALGASCGGSPSGRTQEPTEAPGEALPDGVFSARRALGELEQIVAYGPRPAGSEAARAARRHIREVLEDARIPVERVETRVELPELGELRLEHLVATLPGASADRIVLVAPYDSAEPTRPGASDGASGAAVLIELARVFAHRDFPYTLEFVWLEGEGRLGRGPGELADTRWLGSRSLAAEWAAAGRLDGIRLLVAVNRVCEPELEIARDLGSHRNHREELFRAARALGRDTAFPADRPYLSVHASHLAFRRAGLRAVVALEDSSLDPPAADDAPERCAETSLGTVGLVLGEGIERIGSRLAKIDRFARVPAAQPEEAAVEGALDSADVGGEPAVPLQPGAGAGGAESP